MNRLPCFFLCAELYARTPFAIGSGRDDITDCDILLDESGKPFIPGSSLAGVCRSFLRADGMDTDGLFGYIGKQEVTAKDGKTEIRYIEQNSRIRFYEAFLDGNWSHRVRDGVRIGEDNVAEDTGKFDYEIVDFSNHQESYFDFRISIACVTEADRKAIGMILNAFERNSLSIGRKTSRGFGKFGIRNVRAETITDIDGLLAFTWEDTPKPFAWETYENEKKFPARISTAFAVSAFLSVSDSATLETRPDDGNFIASQPLKNAANLPVIPGTSWAGIFRHHFSRILTESGLKNGPETEDFLNTVFGNTGHASMIIFEESVIDGSICRQQTRNAIDRFTGGAGYRKLFTDSLSFGGTLTLTVSFRTDLGGMTPEILALTENLTKLTIRDLSDGTLSVGGFGSIGGGILKQSEETV